jgi:hypothetical protein
MSTPDGRHLRVLDLERKKVARDAERADTTKCMIELKDRWKKLVEEETQSLM